MNIFLDDIRDTPFGFKRTYTVEQTIQSLKTDKIDILSLDNDLGEGELEGYKVLDFIEYEVYNGNHKILPNKIIIHSANPVARQRMAQIINKLYH